MKHKKLLAIHLNEFNYDYLKYGAKKYKLKNIKKLLAFKKIRTFTKDKTQNKNLDPWVQSVSINTGIPSKKHKIFKLGQKLDNNICFIWDILIKKKVDCFIWGSINSNFIKNKYIKIFFPDPWNYTSNVVPSDLKQLHILPKYYAKNYIETDIYKIVKYSFLFLKSFIKNKGIKFVLKNFSLLFYSLFAKGLKNYILFFLFDLISLNIFKQKINSKNSSFSYIFLNSLAHFQHNNWNDIKAEKYYFLYTDKIIKSIFEIYKSHDALFIFNGFSQKKIKNEFILRPKNPLKFLKNIIHFKSMEQDMTNGGFIFFKDKRSTNIAFNKIKNYKICGIKIFETLQRKDLSFYYRIVLKSRKDLKNINRDSIDKKKLYYLFYYENKNKKIQIKFNFIQLSEFLDSVQFIKTTGVHSTNGEIIFDNLKNITNKKSIENHKIFNIFNNYFSN
jgi:hypothetical protein